MKKEQLAVFYASIAILFWSTVATAFKLTLKELEGDVLTLMFYAIGISWCCFGGFLFKYPTQKLKTMFSFKCLKQSFFMGGLNPIFYYFVLFTGYHLLPGQEAQPLNYLWPIILTWLSIIFLNQSRHLLHFISLGLSLLGVLIIATHGHFIHFRISNIWGALLCVLSAIIWASYWLLNIKDERPLIEKMFLNFTMGFLMIGLVVLVKHHSLKIGWASGLGVLWIGFFEMGWTYLLWMRALEKTSHIALISNLVYLGPFISLIFLQFIANEKIRVSSFFGLALIISGILMQSIWQFRSKHNEKTI